MTLINSERRSLAAFANHKTMSRQTFIEIRAQALRNISNYLKVLHWLQNRSQDEPAPNHASAAERHNVTANYAGIELSTEVYTAPSDYEGIFAVRGSFQVPAMDVPYTPDGQCDGMSNKTYSQSWWLGIGGDKDGSIYQAGVRGLLQCMQGATTKHIVYYGWIEDFPRDPTEIDEGVFTGKIKAGDVMSVSVNSNYNVAPTGTGVMVVKLTNTTNGVTTGNVRETDNGSPPHQSAEATLERQNQTNGTAYYYPVPSAKPTPSMFYDLKYDFVYETNANTGKKIKFATLLNLDLNKSIGSGAQCGQYNTHCVEAFLNDAKPDVCDQEQGNGSMATVGGYIYMFLKQPEAQGCFASPVDRW